MKTQYSLLLLLLLLGFTQCKSPAAKPDRISDEALMDTLQRRTFNYFWEGADTAQRILNRHSVHKGLVGLKHLTLEELMSIDGIGYVKAIQMQCIGELSRRIAEAEYKPFLTFGNPQSIADYFMERTKYLDKERVYSLLFDSRHCLLGENCISEGTIDHAVISPRDIFIDALSYHAAYVVLLHNHPSGNPEPSRQDICLTKRVAEAGRMLGILLSDHIIYRE